jgi:hypothetical protein
MIGNTKFMIDVENSEMFTPYVYNNLPLGTGDGITTAFDIPLTYFHAEDVEVKIDGVIQDTEDYEVVPQSIRRSLRSLPSADMSKVMAISPVECDTIIPVCTGGLWYNALSDVSTRTIDYDFGEPIAISHIYSKCLPHSNGTSTNHYSLYAQRARLSISEDGENWTEVVDQTGMSNNTMFSKYALPTPVTSRYVRFVVTYHRTSGGTYTYTTDPLVGFGNDVLSVTFTSPPSSGSVLTAKVTSRVPIKNSNFQLGASIQMKFERG